MTGNVKYGILEDTAAGMTYLYNQGVEHRDLKCANCLVTHDWRVKVRRAYINNRQRQPEIAAGDCHAAGVPAAAVDAKYALFD